MEIAMDFPENIKREVKERAAFRCCRCQSIGVHVHHIVPQEDGGSADIDNAAPLCPSCHDYYGGNPEKRKEIRQMRDWWYGRVREMYPDNREIGKIEIIDNKLDQLLQKQISLDSFKSDLILYAQEMINNMTYGTASATASGIINASASPSPSPSPSPYPPDQPILGE
jgi:hypothetical protein